LGTRLANRETPFRASIPSPKTTCPLTLNSVTKLHAAFGSPSSDRAGWVNRIVAEQGLETTVRPRGRPKKSA